MAQKPSSLITASKAVGCVAKVYSLKDLYALQKI
jgi:hypothetical protein